MVKITYRDGTERKLQFPVQLAELREAVQQPIEKVEHFGEVRNRTRGLLYLLELVTEQLETEKNLQR
jgi:hypothetical protein